MVSTVLDNGRTFTNQAVFQTINVVEPRVFQKNAMLHDGRENPASIAYGSERSDKGLFDLNLISDNHRSSNRASDYLAILSQADPSIHLAVFVDLTEKL